MKSAREQLQVRILSQNLPAEDRKNPTKSFIRTVSTNSRQINSLRGMSVDNVMFVHKGVGHLFVKRCAVRVCDLCFNLFYIGANGCNGRC
jgi:hypothetical protein